MIDLKKIKEDFEAADAAARKYENVPDDGTCNLDNVCVHLGRNTKPLRDALKETNRYFYKIYTGWYIVGFAHDGQAARRTKMVEAAADALKGMGYDCYVRYIMD